MPRDRRLDERRDRCETGRRFGGDRRGACACAPTASTSAANASARRGVLSRIQYILSVILYPGGFAHASASSSVSRRAGRAAGCGVLAAARRHKPAASAATVKDEAGQPIKGATITAENPNASPSSFTATTDDKGRFSIIGLKSGQWTFTAQAPGSVRKPASLGIQTIGSPNPPLTFTLKKGGGSAPAGALGGMAAKDLQSELAAADALYNQQKWDEAVAAYKGIMAKAPSLSVINLQIAAAYRNKKDYDSAIAAYNELLKTDPNNDKAIVGIGMTNLEKGDLESGRRHAHQGGAGREADA